MGLRILYHCNHIDDRVFDDIAGIPARDLVSNMPRSLALAALFALICLGGAPHLATAPVSAGNATLRAKAGDSEIVITTTDRLAGAIHSLTWNGDELIDSADHGRELQSAASFDCGLPANEFWAERFNPTEAGSRDDGGGESIVQQTFGNSCRGR